MKYVILSTVEIDGIDHKDSPDYTDAFAAYAEWHNGEPLTENELEAWQDANSDIINQLAHESLR
jgi:hypothetical protein